MTSRTSLTIVADARALSPSEFCRKYPHPFLVTEDEVEEREVDFDSATTRLPRGLLTAMEPLSAFPREIVPVRRRDESPYAERITVGRAADVDIQLAAATISKDHGAFLQSGGGWRVIDHGSQNGSFVQGERLPPGKERVLQDGDSVTFGPDLRFRFFDARTLYHVIRGFVDPRAL